MQTALMVAGALALILLAFAAGIAFRLWRRLTGRHVRRGLYAARRALIEPWATMLYPPGPGPFPAVLLFHGCGGVRRVMHAYAEAAVKTGCAAMIVDSLTPRGIGYEAALARVCTGRELWGRERAGDLYAALDIARDDPRIESRRLALAGWSHGGWTVLDAFALAAMRLPPDGMSAAPSRPFEGVRGAFLVYPYVSGPSLARRNPIDPPCPIEAILVAQDGMASETDAAETLARAKAGGAAVVWSTLGGVTHGFDEPDHHPDSVLRYDGEATAHARAAFTDFLQRRLQARPI